MNDSELGVTVFGCAADETTLFRDVAAHLGVQVTLVDAPLCETNARLARAHRCVSVSHKAPVTSATLLALKRAGVEYLSTRSVGLDHINLTYATSVGISVGNVDYSPDSVADYTLMLMLMAVRNMKATIRRTDLHDYRLPDTRGKELRDLTVGVVGTGRIGSAVIHRLSGFGSRVLAHDPNPHVDATYMPLDELLQSSDIVTLHTPLTPTTQHLLDRRRLELLKPGAYVINTGRGSLIDTNALLDAAESGRLGGAGLDVIEGESGIFYTDCHERRIENEALVRLQSLPNVVITPHSAFYTDHGLRDTVENSLINCLTFRKARTA